MNEIEMSPRIDEPPPKASRLWLWFVAAFALQLTVWGVWFVIASQHRVAEVPLAKAAGDAGAARVK